MFAVMLADRKTPYRMMDSSIVRAHQQSAPGRGAKKTRRWGEVVED
jgi:putative transposase